MKTEDLKLFHQIVETGSIIRAAEILNLPKSNLSRRLKGLEDELKILLFHRQSRSMQLTHSGTDFYEKTKPILNELEKSIQDVTAPNYEISGHLRLHMLPLPEPKEIGRLIFKFMDLYPKVSMEILTSGEDKNLIEQHIDVAIRISETLKDSDLIARPFQSSTFSFYASSDYIERNGAPTSPADMQNHNVIRYRFPDGRIYNKIPLGERDEMVEANGNLVMDNGILIIQACLLGKGICFMPDYLAAEHLESGDLVRVLDDYRPVVKYNWLVYPSRNYLSLTTRTFIDFMLAEGEEHMMRSKQRGNIHYLKS
jgi:DNA-binding transcriptional LysR family regulator